MSRQLNFHVLKEIFERFKEADPEPKGELNHTNVFTLLVAVALSAQATAKNTVVSWSGGATPAHGMRISCVEAGPAGGWCLSVSNAGVWIFRSDQRGREFELGTRFRKMFIRKWFPSRSRICRVR